MRLITNICALFGAFVAALWLAGTVGIGNFSLHYGAAKNQSVPAKKQEVVHLAEPGTIDAARRVAPEFLGKFLSYVEDDASISGDQVTFNVKMNPAKKCSVRMERNMTANPDGWVVNQISCL